jgi:hypothetical protein
VDPCPAAEDAGADDEVDDEVDVPDAHAVSISAMAAAAASPPALREVIIAGKVGAPDVDGSFKSMNPTISTRKVSIISVV